MKLVSFSENHREQLGLFFNDSIYPLAQTAKNAGKGQLPGNMNDFLHAGEQAMDIAKKTDDAVKTNPEKEELLLMTKRL